MKATDCQELQEILDKMVGVAERILDCDNKKIAPAQFKRWLKSVMMVGSDREIILGPASFRKELVKLTKLVDGNNHIGNIFRWRDNGEFLTPYGSVEIELNSSVSEGIVYAYDPGWDDIMGFAYIKNFRGFEV